MPRRRAILFAHAGNLAALAFALDDHQLLSAGYAERLLWDFAGGPLQERIALGAEHPLAVTYGRDSGTILVAAGTMVTTWATR